MSRARRSHPSLLASARTQCRGRPQDRQRRNDIQRERIGILLGQLRDLQAEYTEGTAQRLAIENSTLKQRVRELTDDNRTIEQKRQAARSNNRFLDKRLADLEAQLIDASYRQAPS